MDFDVGSLMKELFLVGKPDCGYLVLVRHGESIRQSNTEQHDGESLDTPLSSKGRNQASLIAERLSERTIHSLYSSPMKRAKGTADEISDVIDCPVEVEKDLREIEIHRDQVSDKETQIDSIMQKATNKQCNDFKWDDLGFTESSESLRSRTTDCIDDIKSNHPGETAVLVSHTGVINAFLAEILGIESDFVTLPAHTGLSVVRCHEEQNVILTVNDYSHLR